MIGYLSGVVRYRDLDAVCIEAGGIGWRVLMPLPDLVRVQDPPARAEAWVHTHVREDAIQLFGFATQQGLLLFEKLIGISGVGPKTALSLLSGLPAEDVVAAIVSGDEARLTKIPGVGKKTAARIILELQEKMAKQGGAAPGAVPVKGSALDDVRSALVNLGYKGPQVERIVEKLKPKAQAGATLEELVREALVKIT